MVNPISTDRPEMPGYGIATGPDGLLPWPWAVARLTDARRYWLATSAGGPAHLAAVWAVWLAGELCFSTGGRSRKARDLAIEPRCSLCPEGAAESVVLEGVARRILDADRLAELGAAYGAKYGSGPPAPDENPVYAVAPVTVIGLIEGEPDFTQRATRWHFASAEP